MGEGQREAGKDGGKEQGRGCFRGRLGPGCCSSLQPEAQMHSEPLYKELHYQTFGGFTWGKIHHIISERGLQHFVCQHLSLGHLVWT